VVVRYRISPSTPWLVYCQTDLIDSTTWVGCTRDEALPAGTIEFSVLAIDRAGNFTTGNGTTFTITILTSLALPVVSIPLDEAIVLGARPIFSGTAAQGTSVLVWENHIQLCQATISVVDRSWSCTSTENLASGQHLVTIYAEDAGGITSPSVTRSFTVANSVHLPFIVRR
jgi:hypothetical protein